MTNARMNSIVGLTDYDEGTNLSCYLLQHGWNTDHATSAEEVLSDVEEGGYSLVVIDEEMLYQSNWTLAEYLEALGPSAHTLVLTEPGSHIGEELDLPGCRFLQHPYTYESLRLAIEAATEEEELFDDESYREYAEVLDRESEEGESDDTDDWYTD